MEESDDGFDAVIKKFVDKIVILAHLSLIVKQPREK